MKNKNKRFRKFNKVIDLLELTFNIVPKNCRCNGCGKSCIDDSRDYYMVKHSLWEKIAIKKKGMLCMDCFEKRLGRRLEKEDILICPVSVEDNWYTSLILKDNFNGNLL
jgi:hypothetical protein